MHIRKKRMWLAIGSVAAVAVGFVVASAVWYSLSLRPVSTDSEERATVVVEPGMGPSQIADLLYEKQLIHSSMAFSLYVKWQNVGSGLQAGTHYLSASQSTPEIVASLQKAETSDLVVQFVPGAMLRDNSSMDAAKKQDVRSTLERLGYDRAEIEQAFNANYTQYNDTLFRGRPAGAGIEGYVYGETYHVEQGASVEQILRRSFDEFLKQINEHGLEAQYEAQGLSLYEGITLASIVQKEVSCHGSQVCDDQKQVSQVFHKRLVEGISLGADATFMYAAAQAGQTPTVNFDSPYNTRIHSGLTPGPISSPGLGALLAVGDPAPGDFLFFVSGDDGVNYFSRTEAEHIDNTRRYCDVNCRLP